MLKQQGNLSIIDRENTAAVTHSFLLVSVILLQIFAVMLLGCSEDGQPSPVTAPLAELYPVDGVIDFSHFTNIRNAMLKFIDVTNFSIAKKTELKWIVLNDDINLYMALEWTDDTYNHDYTFSGPVDFDGAQLLIDNNTDGVYGTGEDKRMIITASVGAQYLDEHVSDTDESDLTGDGFGWLKYYKTEQKYQAEFLFPLKSDTNGQDADIESSIRYNILLFDHASTAVRTGNIALLKPSLDSSKNWVTFTLVPTESFQHPEIPKGLSGLIVFTSTHENEKGEIYTFNPATKEIFRVTNNDLFEENVSLSHDRKKIAYHAATDKDDFTTYEIYTIDTDGSGLQQITKNSILDGHPGWSPDDAKIAYASFRDARASIIVMTAEGEEIADLTPPQFDDNDPDWLPDGRIIFKTDRFSDKPELRIAVMDEDGENVHQVTFTEGVVDHDPIGDATSTVFERLMAAKSYTEDIEALFTPWNIIEARLDGSGEKSLKGDVWINWLPVYDPTGKYIVYLKSAGYTEARLMTRSGEDLGRLVPDITRLTYIDWK